VSYLAPNGALERIGLREGGARRLAAVGKHRGAVARPVQREGAPPSPCASRLTRGGPPWDCLPPRWDCLPLAGTVAPLRGVVPAPGLCAQGDGRAGPEGECQLMVVGRSAVGAGALEKGPFWERRPVDATPPPGSGALACRADQS